MANPSHPKRLTSHTQARRIALVSMVGTSIQYFEFFSYSLAAVLIFPDVFFPHLSSSGALLASFSSIGVAFITRPLGALIFGHFADRSGRKRALLASLSLMGLSTTLIGLLPSFNDAGWAAPIALTVLRMAQGTALGAEGMGATVMAIEFAPPSSRGLYSAFPGAGASLGSLSANIVFLGLSQAVGAGQFEAWGWRVPFLAGALLLGISLYARLSVAETPVFVAAQDREGAARMPLMDVVRAQPKALALGAVALLAGNVLYFVTHTFALAHGTSSLGVPSDVMLTATLVALAVQTVAGFSSAVLSDRFGRRRTALVGVVLCGGWAFPMMGLLNSAEPVSITWALAMAMLAYGICSGPLGALLAGVFPTRYRFTAVALVFNSGVLVGGALAPAVADRLLAVTGSPWSVAWMVAFTATLSLAALLKLTERHPGHLGDAPTGTTAPHTNGQTQHTRQLEEESLMPAHARRTACSTPGTDTGQDSAVEEVAADEGAVADVARMATLFTPWTLRAAVTLGVFDLIAKGVNTPVRMAEHLGADAGSLHRLLRHLANLGLLHTTSADRYRLSPTGAVLKSGHPSGLARGLDQSDAWAAAGDRAVPEILFAVRTGSPAWAKVFGEPFWQSLSNDARLAAGFDAAMSVHAAAVGPWVAGARDWGANTRVADIGGGTGGTLRSILARHPHLTGTLIDLPETVARARENPPAQEEPTGTADTAARMTFCPQSFFAPLPSGHDVLLLAHILHDWADDECVRLLRRCAEALPGTGTVVVVDRVVGVDSGEEQLPVSQRDLAMMVVLGGRERTEHEFCLLAAEAGLGLLRPSMPAPHQGLHLLEFGKRQ